MTDINDERSNSKLYFICGICGLFGIAFGFLEMGITAVPGSAPIQGASAEDWFLMYNHNAFLAMRNLGLVNVFMIAFMMPLVFALALLHRKQNIGWLAFTMSLCGSVIYISGTRFLPMLTLSHQYLESSSMSQRIAINGAGEAQIAIGKTHTPGTFAAFIISDIAGFMLAVVVLRGKRINKIAAICGLAGYSLMVIFEILSSFVPHFMKLAMLFASFGGILLLIWYTAAAIGLIKISRLNSNEAQIIPSAPAQ